MSDRRKITSPENGRLSKGPITQAGKDRSSRNAIRHGLLARFAVLEGENEELFDESVRSYYARFQPQDELEESLVDDMAASYWRIQRSLAIESRWMNKEIKKQTSGDAMECIASAFGDLADTTKYNLLQRYDARLHRTFQRALHNLIDLRKLPPIVEPAAVTPGSPAPEPAVERLSSCSEPPLQPPPTDIEEPAAPQPSPCPESPAQGPGTLPTQEPAELGQALTSLPSGAENPPAGVPANLVPPQPQPNRPGIELPKHSPSDPLPNRALRDGLKAA